MKQMKKQEYCVPELELLMLQDEDVLTASAGFEGEEHELFHQSDVYYL